MKQLPILLLACLLFFSCAEEGYFKNKLVLSKTADNCTNKDTQFAMESNINGERYTFNTCLEENYDIKNCSISKTHDSVLVNFKRDPAGKQVTYKATVDIDTYPRYNYIIIDGNSFVVVPSGN